MNPLKFGLLAGAVFGSATALSMMPLQFADKPTALMGAFLSRFAIGFLIPQCTMPISGIAKGALVGLLISMPDAVITKGYVPIIAIGVLGGAVIGWLAARFASKPDI